jgi:predicted negative regulator of RcsB-dependent stress response
MEAESSQSSSVEFYYRLMAWVNERRKALLIGLGVVAALGVIIGFMAWSKSQRAADAEAKLFDIPVSSSPNAAVMAPTPSAYLNIARDYPNTSAGEYAVLLAAETLFVDGNYAESEREFSAYLADHPDSPLAPQAKLGVAACMEAEGKTSEALQKYQTVVSSYPNELNVTEPAKLTMARLYEQQNRPDQALSFYTELARSQNPYDPWAAEARDRGELLLAKHPELRRTESAQAPGAVAAPQATGQPGAAAAPSGTAPSPTPAPAAKPASQGLNLLNFPAASPSNAPTKP